jgi:hypothetical protein
LPKRCFAGCVEIGFLVVFFCSQFCFQILGHIFLTKLFFTKNEFQNSNFPKKSIPIYLLSRIPSQHFQKNKKEIASKKVHNWDKSRIADITLTKKEERGPEEKERRKG